MRMERAVVAVALGVMTLTTAACSSGTANPPVGKVCGVTALAGGPPSAVGVKDRALLHVCPSRQHQTSSKFSVVASNGKRYVVRTYDSRQWSANLPGGTYRAVGAPGCPGLERRFVVTAGKTIKGVVVWFGCDYM